MTNSTTTTAIEMVIASGLKDANLIESFVISQGKAITVPMLEEGLDYLVVGYQKKMPKAVKINLFARALEMDIDELAASEEESATDESSVAETKPEEEIEMTKEQKAAEIRAIREKINAGQAEAEVFVREKRFQDNLTAARHTHDNGNPVSSKVDAQIEETVKGYFSRLGEFRVEIIRYVPVQNDRFERVGYVDVQFPTGYAMIGIWNDAEKKKEWYDFAEFNYNQMVKREKWSAPYSASGMTFNLELGHGVIRLGVRKDYAGELYVRMPMDKGKEEGVFFDVLRTSDIRWGRPNSSNNANIEAALSAALRFYAKTLKLDNPANRNDFDASCMNCRNMTWFGMKDGIDDDLNLAVNADAVIDNPKSTRILNQPDVETLAQKGSHIMQGYCTKRKFFVDQEAVDMINALSGEERRYYDVEVLDPITGEIRIEQRFQGRDEVIVAGKPIKVRDIRVESTRETCRTCPFYHKNAYKGEAQVGAEKVEAREKLISKAKSDAERTAANNARVYVNEYWTTRAVAGRQAFETLLASDPTDTVGTWVPGFPAEVTNDMNLVLDIRVAGIGVNVYFGDAMMGSMTNEDFAFVPGVEEFKKHEAEFNKLIGTIFYAAFNRSKINKEKFEQVLHIIYVDGKPEGLTEKQSERWESAVHWFEVTLEQAKEREAAKNRPDFARKFYAGIEGYMAAKGLTETPDLMALGVREVHIEEILFETINRVVKGALKDGYETMFEEYELKMGYEDLQPKDFIRFLDDAAGIYVLDCLVDGVEYVVTGGKGIEMDDEEKFAIDNHYTGDAFAKAVEDMMADAGLVADTLQLMLQRQINGLLYGVNRAGERPAKVEEFSAINVCEEALFYIAQHAGLLK